MGIISRTIKILKFCMPCCFSSIIVDENSIFEENIQVDENIIVEEKIIVDIEMKVDERHKLVIDSYVDEVFKRCSRQTVNFGDTNYVPRKLKYFDDFDISLEPIFEDNREEIEELKCLIEYYQKIDNFKIFY